KPSKCLSDFQSDAVMLFEYFDTMLFASSWKLEGRATRFTKPSYFLTVT
ncbi:MAG: hypothetical protein ACI9LN_004435, partial [Saprospiraceae bacterium]